MEETRCAAVWGECVTGRQLVVMEGPAAAGAETLRVKLCLTGANCLRGTNTTCHYHYRGATTLRRQIVDTHSERTDGGTLTNTHQDACVRHTHTHTHTHTHFHAYTAGTHWQVYISAAVPSAHREAANSL